jgi:hypothetical protein
LRRAARPHEEAREPARADHDGAVTIRLDAGSHSVMLVELRALS